MAQTTLLPAASAQAILLAASAQQSPCGIVSRTVLDAPELRIVLFSFAAGQELTSHASRRRAVVQVLDGSCEFLFEGTWHALAAGSLLHLPPGHVHAVKASAGPFSMLLTLAAEAPAPSSP